MSENRYVLPQVWEWKKLGDAYVVKDGTHDSPKFVDEGYPLYTSKNLTENGLDNSNFKYISEDDYLKINLRSKVDKGDLLFAMIGTIGNPTIVNFEPNFAIKNMALFKKRNDNYLIEYLKYYLSSSFVIRKMLKEANGATQKFVGLGYLRNFYIPLPPLEEQRRIIGKLDGLFAKIDKSIALLDESIASASSLMPSALNEVFEEFDEKWEKESIEKIAQIIDGDRGENYPKKDEFFEKEYCLFLSAKNVTKNGFAFKENQFITREKDAILRKGRLQKYDLVLTTRGTIGNVAFFDDSVPFEIIRLNSGMVILRVFNENINHKFLYIFLNSPIFESFLNEIQNGAAQPQISIRNFKSLQIPLPPLDIQTQTVAYLDALHVKAEALKKAQEKKKEALLALKASLLESAFKGEL